MASSGPCWPAARAGHRVPAPAAPDAPLLPLDIFASKRFSFAAAASLAAFSAGISFVALPFLFQSVYGYSAIQSALLFTPWPVVVTVAAPLSGRLSDKINATLLSTIGVGIFALGLFLIASMDHAHDVTDILWRLGLCGLGFGFPGAQQQGDAQQRGARARAPPRACWPRPAPWASRWARRWWRGAVRRGQPAVREQGRTDADRAVDRRRDRDGVLLSQPGAHPSLRRQGRAAVDEAARGTMASSECRQARAAGPGSGPCRLAAFSSLSTSMEIMMSDSKTLVVIGGSSGIGLRTAQVAAARPGHHRRPRPPAPGRGPEDPAAECHRQAGRRLFQHLAGGVL